LTRYLAFFESAFLVRRIPAWAGSRARRAIKTPRVLIPDAGLLGHLAGLTPSRLSEDTTAVGPLFESLVASELLKQLAWNDTHAELFHFRTHAGREVALVPRWTLQNRPPVDGVKPATSVASETG
jgi:predicted AAA+ superfamily ATPase